MSNLQEVPTDDLLSFHEYPSVPVHNQPISATGTTTVSVPVSEIDVSGNLKTNNTSNSDEGNNTMQQSSSLGSGPNRMPDNGDETEETPTPRAFWTLQYYQKYFDVDTSDVVERILLSMKPKWDNSLKHHLRTKPDIYGPFWISVTLIFTIAISGNVTNYLHHASSKYWKYDFHLVSYAATTIWLYITLVPFILWGILKSTSDTSSVTDIENLSEENVTPGAIELICIYGYSLFIYIPAAVLWTIQINFVQWLIVIGAALTSGTVLLLTLIPALRLSKHKLTLMIGIIVCHVLLAAGFMLYFFHMPPSAAPIVHTTFTPEHLVVRGNSTG